MNTSFCDRIVIALSICTAHMATIQAAPELESRWTRQLSSSNAAEADQAALKSFQDGRNSLRDLVILLDDDRPFTGKFLYSDREAALRPTKPSLSYVAMYLIHAILEERLYENPVPYLKRTNGTDVQGEDLDRAKAAYRAWWTKWKPGETKKTDPLDGTDLAWR